jgi:hypothetical protein
MYNISLIRIVAMNLPCTEDILIKNFLRNKMGKSSKKITSLKKNICITNEHMKKHPPLHVLMKLESKI